MGYLALDPEDTPVSFLRVLAEARTPFLWITSGSVSSVPEGGEIVRVTTLPGMIGSVDPKRLREILATAATFLDERGPGALVIDCLRLLVVHSGVERVLRFIEDLHEEAATRNAIFVVFADPRELNPRAMASLERELERLPRNATLPLDQPDLVA